MTQGTQHPTTLPRHHSIFNPNFVSHLTLTLFLQTVLTLRPYVSTWPVFQHSHTISYSFLPPSPIITCTFPPSCLLLPKDLIHSSLLLLPTGVQRWSLCAECCWCQGCWTGVQTERAPLLWQDGWVNKRIRGLCHIVTSTHPTTHTRPPTHTHICTNQMYTHRYLL